MNDEKLEKLLKDCKWFSIIVLILLTILFVLNFSAYLASPLSIILFVFQIVLLLANAIGCSQKKIYGPICGVVVALLMIISLSLLDIIIGVIYLIECISIIKYMKTK